MIIYANITEESKMSIERYEIKAGAELEVF
jgi:hypothetical protein